MRKGPVKETNREAALRIPFLATSAIQSRAADVIYENDPVGVEHGPVLIYSVHDRFGKENQLDAIIARMFHGIGFRRGVQYPLNEYYHLLSWCTEPLKIHREGSRIPHITIPAENLVVKEDVARRLEALPNLKFFEVTFEKLFQFKYSLGDFSYRSDPRYMTLDDPTGEAFIDLMGDDSKLHKNIGRYYEVLHYSAPELRKMYPNAKRIKSGFVEGEVSQRMATEQPLVAGLRGYFVNQKCFHILKPFLDEDFYEINPIEI